MSFDIMGRHFDVMVEKGQTMAQAIKQLEKKGILETTSSNGYIYITKIHGISAGQAITNKMDYGQYPIDPSLLDGDAGVGFEYWVIGKKGERFVPVTIKDDKVLFLTVQDIVVTTDIGFGIGVNKSAKYNLGYEYKNGKAIVDHGARDESIWTEKDIWRLGELSAERLLTPVEEIKLIWQVKQEILDGTYREKPFVDSPFVENPMLSRAQPPVMLQPPQWLGIPLREETARGHSFELFDGLSPRALELMHSLASGRPRTAPSRQSTLGAALEWTAETAPILINMESAIAGRGIETLAYGPVPKPDENILGTKKEWSETSAGPGALAEREMERPGMMESVSQPSSQPYHAPQLVREETKTSEKTSESQTAPALQYSSAAAPVVDNPPIQSLGKQTEIFIGTSTTERMEPPMKTADAPMPTPEAGVQNLIWKNARVESAAPVPEMMRPGAPALLGEHLPSTHYDLQNNDERRDDGRAHDFVSVGSVDQRPKDGGNHEGGSRAIGWAGERRGPKGERSRWVDFRSGPKTGSRPPRPNRMDDFRGPLSADGPRRAARSAKQEDGGDVGKKGAARGKRRPIGAGGASSAYGADDRSRTNRVGKKNVAPAQPSFFISGQVPFMMHTGGIAALDAPPPKKERPRKTAKKKRKPKTSSVKKRKEMHKTVKKKTPKPAKAHQKPAANVHKSKPAHLQKKVLTRTHHKPAREGNVKKHAHGMTLARASHKSGRFREDKHLMRMGHAKKLKRPKQMAHAKKAKHPLQDARAKKAKKIKAYKPPVQRKKSRTQPAIASRMKKKPLSIMAAAAPKKSKRLAGPAARAKAGVRAILFDLDGVLSDSEPLHFKTINAVFAPYGVRISPKYMLSHYRGTGSRFIIEDVVRKRRLPVSVEVLLKKRMALFADEIKAGHIKPMPGAKEVVKWAKQKGLRVVVASGGHKVHVAAQLKAMGMGKLPFVGLEDVKHHKPNPEAFLKAAKKVGAAPHECLVIEDSTAGLAAAKAAGMRCILIGAHHPKGARKKASLWLGKMDANKIARWLGSQI